MEPVALLHNNHTDGNFTCVRVAGFGLDKLSIICGDSLGNVSFWDFRKRRKVDEFSISSLCTCEDSEVPNADEAVVACPFSILAIICSSQYDLIIQCRNGMYFNLKKTAEYNCSWKCSKLDLANNFNIEYPQFCLTYCAAVGFRNRFLAPADDNRELALIDSSTLETQSRLCAKFLASTTFEAATVRCIKVSGDNGVIAGYETGHVALFTITDAEQACDVLLSSICDARATKVTELLTLDVCGATNIGVVAGMGNTVEFFRVENNCTHLTFFRALTMNSSEPLMQSEICFRVARISDDGRLFATGSSTGSIFVYSMKSFKPLGVLNTHADSVCDLAFLPSSTTLASSFGITTPRNDERNGRYYIVSAGKDNVVALWQLY